MLFSGDTLFSGGPGATGRSFSDFPTIVGSIRERLFTLPEDTRVHTGHGDATTIGAETPHLAEWIAPGTRRPAKMHAGERSADQTDAAATTRTLRRGDSRGVGVAAPRAGTDGRAAHRTHAAEAESAQRV